MRNIILTILVAVGLGLALAPLAAAQDADTGPAPLTVDGRLEGGGPWTSWLGAAPQRMLVLTVTNTSAETVIDPTLTLTVGRGADPDDAVAAPQLGSLAPGESTTVRVAVDFPRAAVGTYTVVGVFADLPGDPGFRAETRLFPWLLVLVPGAIVVQLGLLSIRNRVRRRLHTPPTAAVTSDPPDPPDSLTAMDRAEGPADPLEAIIEQELGSVFDGAFVRQDDEIDDAEFRELVIGLSGTTADRVAERAELDERNRERLRREIADAVLEAFGMAPVAVS